MDKFRISIHTGLKLVVWGIPLGLTLRLIQMNLFFDFDTGFYTGPGAALAWLGLLLPAAMAGAGAWCFHKNAGAFMPRDRGMARGPGIFAGFSGGVLLVMGLYMLRDHLSRAATGFAEFETAVNPGLHLSLCVLCLVLGALHCFLAVCLCAGRDPFKKAPLLYLPGVAWGMAQLVAVYVFYARSSSTVENLYSLISSGLMLLALFYLSAALSGAGEPRALMRLYIFGGLSAVLTIPYDLSNIVLALRGTTYFGELPAIYALGRLSVCMFLLSFILSVYRTGVDKGLDGAVTAKGEGA